MRRAAPNEPQRRLTKICPIRSVGDEEGRREISNRLAQAPRNSPRLLGVLWVLVYLGAVSRSQYNPGVRGRGQQYDHEHREGSDYELHRT